MSAQKGIDRSVFFSVNWWGWNALGAGDLNSLNSRSYRFWSAVLLNVVTSSFTMMLLLEIFTFKKGVEGLWNFNLSLTSVATTTKFVIYVVKLKKIMQVEKLSDELDRRINSEEQRNCRENNGKDMRFISKLFVWTFGVILISSNVSFLFEKERSLPLPAWFPLDWKSSWLNYVVAVFHQLLALNTQILQNFVDDSFPPIALCLLASHCELLILRISSIGYDERDVEENEEELLRCIKDQEKIYMMLQLIMDIISWPMLVQFVVIAIDVGSAMCILVFYVEDTQERLYYTSFIFGLALEIFPVCYYGTLVAHVFGRLHYAIFCSNWVDQSVIFRKNVIILAERTKRLPELVAGNLVPIALTTFLANCKAAYSFMTLIADTQKDN